MILALHSLADIFTKIRYSWGQCPKKKHPFFWAAQIEFDTFHFCGKLPKLWAGEGVGFGQCPKEMFFLGRRPLIENEKKAEVLTVSK